MSEKKIILPGYHCADVAVIVEAFYLAVERNDTVAAKNFGAFIMNNRNRYERNQSAQREANRLKALAENLKNKQGLCETKYTSEAHELELCNCGHKRF